MYEQLGNMTVIYAALEGSNGDFTKQSEQMRAA
jgi:hypothetical protein